MSEPTIDPAGVGVRYCPVCGKTAKGTFNPGPGGRPDASCPNCASLERHRFLALLLSFLRPGLGDIDVLLDVAPSPQVTPLLAKLGPKTHIRFDIGADNRLVDVVGSLTEAPFEDDYVDLLVCYHVLEHIPDDAAAMSEIARLLRPGGLAVLQVPWRKGSPTDEDPDAPEDVRLARFGQADHVRYYGDDFEDRLVRAGLRLTRLTPETMLGRSLCDWLRLNPVEAVWLATPQDAPHAAVLDPAGTEPLSGMLEAMLASWQGERAAARKAKDRLTKTEAKVAALQRREGLVYRLARRLPPGVRDSAPVRQARSRLKR